MKKRFRSKNEGEKKLRPILREAVVSLCSCIEIASSATKSMVVAGVNVEEGYYGVCLEEAMINTLPSGETQQVTTNE